jgi:hypothetical protein
MQCRVGLACVCVGGHTEYGYRGRGVGGIIGSVSVVVVVVVVVVEHRLLCGSEEAWQLG